MRSDHRAMLVLGFGISLVSLNAQAAGSGQDLYRDDLVKLVGVIQSVREQAGPNAPGSQQALDRAAQLFAAFSDAQIDQLASHLPAGDLHAVVHEAEQRLQTTRRRPAKTAVVAAPDVTPAFCTDYPAPVVYAALATKLITRHVIEAAEFTCHSSVLGFNAALGCEAPEIAAAAAETASALADFCGNQQSAATYTALLETERSVGRHLNTKLDAPMSTLASQLALDAAAQDANTASTASADIKIKLDQDFVQIDAQLDDAIADLANLASALSDIQARTDDVVFRVQAAQVDVEDAQDRGADLQARATELETVLTGTRSEANQLASSADAFSPAMQASARQQRRDELGLALGNANLGAGLLAMPISAGGRLEEAREVLIEAITALQTLGQGDTTAAITALAAGDAQYNQGQFPQAWIHYAQAYRQLDPHLAAQSGSAP